MKQISEMSNRLRRMIEQIKNNVRTLQHGHLDRLQRRLIADTSEKLDLLLLELQQRGESEMAKHIAGGGPASKTVVRKPVKTGAGNRGVSVGAVGQLGQKQGDHITNRGHANTGYRGEGPIHQGAALRPAQMGNAKALDVGKGGCGTGRTIYKTGQQQQWGTPAPGNAPAKNRDILSEFGGESPKRQRALIPTQTGERQWWKSNFDTTCRNQCKSASLADCATAATRTPMFIHSTAQGQLAPTPT